MDSNANCLLQSLVVLSSFNSYTNFSSISTDKDQLCKGHNIMRQLKLGIKEIVLSNGRNMAGHNLLIVIFT